MAGKKPAKRNITNTKEVKKELPGKAIMYFGSKDANPFVCPKCSKTLIKGIVYEHANDMYCSRGCLPAPEMVA